MNLDNANQCKAQPIAILVAGCSPTGEMDLVTWWLILMHGYLQGFKRACLANNEVIALLEVGALIQVDHWLTPKSLKLQWSLDWLKGNSQPETLAFYHQIPSNIELVGGLEHVLFFHILGSSSSQLTFIFFRGLGGSTTHEI